MGFSKKGILVLHFADEPSKKQAKSVAFASALVSRCRN
jgi:hypothetical protein